MHTKLTTWVWVGEWRGDSPINMRVGQFKCEQSRDDMLAGKADTFFKRDISVACVHVRTDEELSVKTIRDIKLPRCGRLKAAIKMGRVKRVSNGKICFNRMTDLDLPESDLNPRVYTDAERDPLGEEHGDDLLIVGEVSMLEHVREQPEARVLF